MVKISLSLMIDYNIENTLKNIYYVFADPNTKPALSQKLCSLVVGFFYIKVSLNYASVSPVVLIAMLVHIPFKLDNG